MCKKRRKCVLVTVRQWLIDFSLPTNFSPRFHFTWRGNQRFKTGWTLSLSCHLQHPPLSLYFYICKSDNQHARASTNCSHPSPPLCFTVAKEEPHFFPFKTCGLKLSPPYGTINPTVKRSHGKEEKYTLTLFQACFTKCATPPEQCTCQCVCLCESERQRVCISMHMRAQPLGRGCFPPLLIDKGWMTVIRQAEVANSSCGQRTYCTWAGFSIPMWLKTFDFKCQLQKRTN